MVWGAAESPCLPCGQGARGREHGAKSQELQQGVLCSTSPHALPALPALLWAGRARQGGGSKEQGVAAGGSKADKENREQAVNHYLRPALTCSAPHCLPHKTALPAMPVMPALPAPPHHNGRGRGQTGKGQGAREPILFMGVYVYIYIYVYVCTCPLLHLLHLPAPCPVGRGGKGQGARSMAWSKEQGTAAEGSKADKENREQAVNHFLRPCSHLLCPTLPAPPHCTACPACHACPACPTSP